MNSLIYFIGLIKALGEGLFGAEKTFVVREEIILFL